MVYLCLWICSKYLLQSLDVGVFDRLKQNYKKLLIEKNISSTFNNAQCLVKVTSKEKKKGKIYEGVIIAKLHKHEGQNREQYNKRKIIKFVLKNKFGWINWTNRGWRFTSESNRNKMEQCRIYTQPS